MKFSILLLLLAWFEPQVVISSSKLNRPRVLLPLFSKHAANYTLEISESGCYEWQLSRLGVIQIIPLEVSPNGCSSKALISTISRELTRNTVIVIAEDVTSGQSLLCDVIVDAIDSLRIVTKTRELYMEEAPELFEVRAYDNQGNEFSTLDNVEFQWNIGRGGRVDQTVFRFMSFKDSPYETPQTVQSLDQKGLKGHMVLLEGLKTGSTKVSVNLPQSEYHHVAPAEVNLMVVANLLIDPVDAYVLKGDTVKFRLFQLRHGRIVELAIPSSQYVFTVENQTIAEAIDYRGNMYALEYGRTRVILQYSHDVNIPLPHAHITVTGPEYLTLSILPHQNWAVEVNTYYAIVVDVYDEANRKFLLGNNAKIDVTVPSEYFIVKSSTRNGTHHFGQPIKTGQTTVQAVLRSVGSNTFSSALTTEEEMMIFSSVVVFPSQYILPWEENLKYKVALEATGGDGSYSWSSSHQKIATVTQSGLVETLGFGEVNITAAMTKNIDNKDSSRVVVTRPTRLQIVDRFSLEAEVGKPIYLHVALFAEDDIKNKEFAFTNCQQLRFTVVLDDSTSFYYEEAFNQKDNVGIACANLAVLGSRIASTRVTVRYKSGDILLEDSAVIGTFNPLTIIQPTRGQTVLAVGTSRHLVFSGGPSHSNLKRGTKKIDYDNSIVDVFDVDSVPQDFYIYSVLCKRVGETNVKIVIGSCGSVDCKRSESVSIVRVFCSLPKMVSFYFDKKNQDCPLKSEIDRVSALNYKELTVTVIVKDNKGRTFDNATSLFGEWLISNVSLASVRYPGLVWLNASYEPKYLIPLNHFQVVVPKKKSGISELTFRILHYRNVLLKKLNIPTDLQQFDDEISATALIHFVDDTTVSQTRIVLFNHPKNTATVEISPGSGHYKIMKSTDDVAKFVWDNKNKHILHITPLNEGNVKLTVQDICLQSSATNIEVEIRQVNSIKVDMINKIQKGKYVLAAVKLYDSSESVLPISQTEFFDLSVETSDEILNIKQHSVNVSRNEIVFQVSGIESGVTNLVFSSSFGISRIFSEPISVRVYPPLRISPKHIVVPVNSKIHINTFGGPYPDCTYEFSSDNENVKILTNGLIEGAKIGQTKVTGMAVGYLKSNKNKIVFSKDTVEVTVVQLEGVKIMAPLLKFVQDAIIPLFVTGLPDNLSPMVLSTLTPGLKFKWSVSSEDVVSIKDVFEPLGVFVKDEDRVSVRLKGLRPGKSIVSLKVFGSNSPVFTDSIQVEVFEDLILVQPPKFRIDSLLLSPDSSYQLKTNKDPAHLKFSVLKNIYSDVDKALTAYDSLDEDILSISSKGLIRVQNKTGRAIISVDVLHTETQKIRKDILVYVKPVQYVMLQVESKLHGDPDVPILALPQGMKLELKTNFYDEYGQKFTAAKHAVNVETNRNDLTMLKETRNNTIITELIAAGESVLRVWDDSLSTKPKDFVKFNVDHLISPQKNHLVTGDVVCFSMNKICNEGFWSSSQPELFTIDSESGIGNTRNKPGTVVVSYYLPECEITANTVVEILPINAIHFVPFKKKIISNALGESYDAELVLFNNYETTTSKSNNLIAPDGAKCQTRDQFRVPLYPFSCNAKFVQAPSSMPLVEDLFIVKPSFSIKTGLYACQFIPKSTHNVTLHKAEVMLKATTIPSTVTSQPVTFIFYPALKVNTDKVVIKHFGLASVILTGFPEVLDQATVTPSNVDYLQVLKGSSGTPTAQPFRIQPTDKIKIEPRTDLYIQVNSPLTQQTIKIPVDLGTESLSNQDSCLMSPSWFDFSNSKSTHSPLRKSIFNSQNWFILIACICGAIIIIVGGNELLKKSQSGTTIPVPEESEQRFIQSPRKVAPLNISKPIHVSSPVHMTRRPFDELSPVYGSPKTFPRKRLPPNYSSAHSSNSSSFETSWNR